MMFRFDSGKVVMTPGAFAALARCKETPWAYLKRHLLGDWGEVSEDDAQENEFSVNNNLRILSAYTLSDGQTRLWIITESDRSASTLLLPEEY